MITKNNLIDDFIKEFADAKSRVNELTQKFEVDKFKINPAKDSWSAGDCLEHLIKANKEYIKNTIDSMSKHGQSNVNNENYKPRFIARKFIESMKPGSKLKLKAPKIFQKKYHGNVDETVDLYFKTMDEFIELADKSRKYDLTIKVPSPVTNLVKFQLGEMFMLTIEHQKRHFAQAEKALKSAK